MLIYVNWDGFSRRWHNMARQDGGTPHLDRLAANGAYLDNHFCGVPAITNPMQQTLISGAWPAKTGNCYAYFDKAARRVVQTGRLNKCENIVQAARRRGLSCASVHGWYFENKGCAAGDAAAPYIQNNLRNFEARVDLLLRYLAGESAPSGEGVVRMQKRPDFLAIYADDIDSVCHNGPRLPYPELARARTVDDWLGNLTYAVRRMDRALGKLLDIPDATIALAADHGGMPFGAALGDVAHADAITPKADALLAAIRGAGVDAYAITSPEDAPPPDAQAVLLILGTQAQLTLLSPVRAETWSDALAAVRALPFIGGCLDKAQLAERGAWGDFCDAYITAKPPHFLGGEQAGEYVGGSHAYLDEDVLRVFCAFAGPGIKQGVRVTQRTDLTDFAPTVCALLGFDGPSDATGRVLTEILA